MIAAAARLAAIVLALAAFPAPAQGERENLADFDLLWRSVERDYPYFEGRRGAWSLARKAWRPRAGRAQSRDDLARALEGLLAELRDDNAMLVDRVAGSPRRVPAETDIRAAWRSGAAVVTDVRTFGDADVAGIRPGDVVASIDGTGVERAMRGLVGTAEGAAARDWALRHVLAGPREGTMRLALSGAGGRRTVEVERRDPRPPNGPAVIARRIGVERDLGYLRIKVALDDGRLVPAFDDALDSLRGTRALILDLREVSGGAGHQATEAILGRFTTTRAAWQKRRPRQGREEVDSVDARASAWREPVVVLVDRWTAGEGEALAAGMAAVAHARLVGTPMAGLHGELTEVRLPHSGIVARFPAQRTFTPEGLPRERVAPDVAIDLTVPQAGPGDPILYRALKLLEK